MSESARNKGASTKIVVSNFKNKLHKKYGSDLSETNVTRYKVTETSTSKKN